MLRWRYGDQLRWRLVTIGLTEQADQYVKRGYTPAGSARGYLRFRRRGMPFATQPRARVSATGLACRAIVATRLQAPDLEHAAFRALQFAWFTTPLVLDDPDDLAVALDRVDGLDIPAVVAALDEPGGGGRLPGRPRGGAHRRGLGRPGRRARRPRPTGPIRYTAPSLIFARDERRLEAGGFQPVEAYDVLIANLDPALERTPPPENPLDALLAFPYGLTTYEVAAIMTPNNGFPDPAAVEGALIDHVADGEVIREPMGDGALWRAGPYPPHRRSDQDRTATGRSQAFRH